MKVVYTSVVPADCTSDPHPVSYGDIEDKLRLKVMLYDVLRVCESDMVKAVAKVVGVLDGAQYESDEYDDYAGSEDKPKKAAAGTMAEKHKVAGLYFDSDAKVPAARHLPPGLTGLKEFIKLAIKASSFEGLTVTVMWTFSGQISCSDRITVGSNSVNYMSQNWYIQSEGYKPWCAAMEKFLSREFPHATTDEE